MTACYTAKHQLRPRSYFIKNTFNSLNDIQSGTYYSQLDYLNNNCTKRQQSDKANCEKYATNLTSYCMSFN